MLPDRSRAIPRAICASTFLGSTLQGPFQSLGSAGPILASEKPNAFLVRGWSLASANAESRQGEGHTNECEDRPEGLYATAHARCGAGILPH